MTAKAALCMHLLKGEVLNIKNCFSLIGLTNCPREISRMIEKGFEVTVSRTTMNGQSRYGTPCTWVNYRLNNTELNAPGRQKMIEYVKEHLSERAEPKTDLEKKVYKQTDLWIQSL